MRSIRLALGLAVWVVLCAAAAAADDGPAPADVKALKDAKVGADAASLLEFFRKLTLTEKHEAKLRALVRQLGDDAFEKRERATEELSAAGAAAVPLLREALKDPDVEIVRRAQECLRRIETGSARAVVAAAARVLATLRPDGAARALLAYLPAADDEATAEEVRAAVVALAVRDGQPDPDVVTALADKAPARRAAAAAALARSEEQRPAVRKLLADAAADVRLAAGLALVAVKDREAVPVLIGLLGDLPRTRVWAVEDVLYRLAEDTAPAATLGADEASQRKYRDAWAAWWKENGEKIDLARLDAKPRALGYTMMIQLDAGRLFEVDADNKVRWEMSGLQFPLDAQYLPGDRVLVAEHGANRVTERTLKGEVVWERQFPSPLMAQRLPNGNTVMASRGQILEIDRDDKVVFSYTRPGEQILKASKLRNGDYAIISDGGRFARLDPSGREVQKLSVALNTGGGRIDVLPDGSVLVPFREMNKVVEFDAKGRAAWEVTFEQPIAAVRLPNGNTLVTSYNQLRAAEIGRDGKAVWEYKADTRITRAWRR